MKTCGIRVFSTDCLCSSWACLLEPRSPPVAAWEGHPGVNFPPNDSGGDLEWLSVLCLKTVVVQVLSLFIFERQREIRWVQGTHWDAGPTLQGPLLLKKPGLKQPELWNPRRLHGLPCWPRACPWTAPTARFLTSLSWTRVGNSHLFFPQKLMVYSNYIVTDILTAVRKM